MWALEKGVFGGGDSVKHVLHDLLGNDARPKRRSLAWNEKRLSQSLQGLVSKKPADDVHEALCC